ncbi:MAG: SLC13 family permease [Anaerolineae bacterium]|nr:SLC13 family permease [Anaerolineae bacterium]MDK1081369.1 SLC13 family permease [Anaerolineae bacterium]MDK1117912.1 SLC13 family permease [Anaerolineae bacterium]
MAPELTPEIILVFGIIVTALIIFGTEKLRVDVVALLVLLTVGLTGLVGPKEVFAGFSNSAVITVWAVYIVSGALFKTGVADILGKFILRLSGNSEWRLIAVIMLTCGVMSAFMNNVGATAMLLPAVVSVAKQAKIPVSKLLIPLSFSSLMGGSVTLIGTPANILATNIVADHGLPTFGFFDFTVIGLIVFGTGILYMLLIGRRLLPVRQPPGDQREASPLKTYISELSVLPDGKLAGSTLLESKLGADYDLTVVGIVRGWKTITHLERDTIIESKDILLVEGSADNLVRAMEELGLVTRDEGENQEELIDKLSEVEMGIVEATLAPRSSMVGRSLRSLQFRERFGFNVLAIGRQGEVITKRLRRIRLKFGDDLLLQGPRHRLDVLQDSSDFLVLEPQTTPQSRRKKMPIAVGLLLIVVTLTITGVLDISLAMVSGAVAMVVTGCLSMDEAYESIDWKTVFLVAGMLPLGAAMESTGAARYVADVLLITLEGYGPLAALAGVYLLAALITQPMSNAAAMVLVVPIALDTALSLEANHLTFVLAAVIGAATSFLTPVGHKANVLVYGPGGYKFFDYARVGALLTLTLFIVTIVALPKIFPLFP